MQQSIAFLHFAWRTTSLRVGGRAARGTRLPGLHRGGGGRQAGAIVLSCLCRVGDAENARHENARNAIVWNTACCICLSIAEQECMSRHERAPDFAANCVLVND